MQSFTGNPTRNTFVSRSTAIPSQRSRLLLISRFSESRRKTSQSRLLTLSKTQSSTLPGNPKVIGLCSLRQVKFSPKQQFHQRHPYRSSVQRKLKDPPPEISSMYGQLTRKTATEYIGPHE